jgi:hypothetical protein
MDIEMARKNILPINPYMKRLTYSIISSLVLLFASLDTSVARTLKDSAFTVHIPQDSLLRSAKKQKVSSYQFGLQIENVVRTGYLSDMNYEYKPVLIQLEFQKPLSKKGKQGWQLDYLIQPQFNRVSFSENGVNTRSGVIKTFEIGVNAGLIVLKSLVKIDEYRNVKIYALGSLGPHYIGASPSRQAKGFLFSDNLRVGLRIPVSSSIIFDLRTGIRHLSNASLKRPNGGLDDILFGAGIRLVKQS